MGKVRNSKVAKLCSRKEGCDVFDYQLCADGEKHEFLLYISHSLCAQIIVKEYELLDELSKVMFNIYKVILIANRVQNWRGKYIKNNPELNSSVKLLFVQDNMTPSSNFTENVVWIIKELINLHQRKSKTHGKDNNNENWRETEY